MNIRFNIFISHDSKDEFLALGIKTFLENIFLNATVYVSGRDLRGGQTWIENIKLSLKSSQVIISIISKESINNNWIYFETGSGFTDDKSIPLITDGLKFSDLVPPLSLLQSRTLSKKGLESLVNDISSKLGLRSPKLLTGIESLLEETDKFLKLRSKEVHMSKVEQIKVPKSKNVVILKKVSNVDPDIQNQYDSAVSKTLNITRAKILTYKEKYDIPSEEELNEYDFGKLQDLAKAYNISYPVRAFTSLLMIRLSPLPSIDSAQWEKLNVTKGIADALSEVDKFEKVQ